MTHSLIERMLFKISLMTDVRSSLFFICARCSLVWYLRSPIASVVASRRSSNASPDAPRNHRRERHAGDHDADADKHGPPEEVVERDERERDLEHARPRDLPVRAQVLQARRVRRLQVDDVACQAAAALGGREDEGCGASQSDASRGRGDGQHAPFL